MAVACAEVDVSTSILLGDFRDWVPESVSFGQYGDGASIVYELIDGVASHSVTKETCMAKHSQRNLVVRDTEMVSTRYWMDPQLRFEVGEQPHLYTHSRLSDCLSMSAIKPRQGLDKPNDWQARLIMAATKLDFPARKSSSCK